MINLGEQRKQESGSHTTGPPNMSVYSRGDKYAGRKSSRTVGVRLRASPPCPRKPGNPRSASGSAELAQRRCDREIYSGQRAADESASRSLPSFRAEGAFDSDDLWRSGVRGHRLPVFTQRCCVGVCLYSVDKKKNKKKIRPSLRIKDWKINLSHCVVVT